MCFMQKQAMTEDRAKAYGYSPVKFLSTGELAGIMPMLFTVALFVGIEECGWRTRFCYDSLQDALAALAIWDGVGDPPGPWIKEKGRVERVNPGWERSHC